MSIFVFSTSDHSSGYEFRTFPVSRLLLVDVESFEDEAEFNEEGLPVGLLLLTIESVDLISVRERVDQFIQVIFL